MNLNQVIHMNDGDDEASYASNSEHVRFVMNMVKPILQENVSEVFSELHLKSLTMADMGCAVGPNTLQPIEEILEALGKTCQRENHPPPSLQVFLNDLFLNDYNTLFRSLPEFYKKIETEKGSKVGPCFIAGMPGSFYGRLFPSDSLHFVHSSYAVATWLSKAPELVLENGDRVINKGNIYVAKTSPPAVSKAYLKQFERDFTDFLKSRAEELVPRGRILVTALGSIKSEDPLSIWEFIGLKLSDMVMEGLIEEEKLDSFDLPYYAATEEEVKKVVEAEGSFTLQRLDVIKEDWDAYIEAFHGKLGRSEKEAILATYMRSVAEPILAAHFGGDIIDDLFSRFRRDVLSHSEANKCEFINLVISLVKKA